MKMKSKKKVFLTVLCAAALVVASVLGTMAFLTSKDQVNNTFTVGKVAITLDEANVTDMGAPVADADRVKANTYKLIPGHEYTKDPTIHVAADSEDSWIFVKVENGLSAIEADTTIADQIKANGWTALEGAAGVYYKNYTSSTAATDLAVFGAFKIKDDADVSTYSNAKIDVYGYAIQKDGFDTPAAAWDEVSK
jgi:predicted ribosomally synthesized peptide with SipW-like signal peptide